MDMVVTVTWDDNRNADGMRPSKEDFKPILGYSGYADSSNMANIYSK